MSKKSKRKNNLRLSIILLILLLILLISSTYAWFTANQTVTISTLNVHIDAQNGLQISTDASTWKSMIDNTDITTGAYDGNINQLPISMEPVSTIGAIDSATGHMLMYYGKVEADKADGGIDKLTATPETDVAGITGKYIAFDMFLRVNYDTQLKMTEGSNVVVKENSADLGIKQASRVAFCIQGTAPAGTALSDITSLHGAKSFLDASKSVYIWEPNPNWHTDAAIAHARDNYGIGKAPDTTALTTTGDGDDDIVTCYGIKQPISVGVPLIDTYKDSENFAAITPDWSIPSDKAGIMPETEIFSLPAGITKVRVYMWVEGQDIDCENTASGSDISYNLQLQVVEDENNP